MNSKHKLVATEEVIQNSTDHRQLAGMLLENKGRLEVKRLTPSREAIRRSGKRYVLYISRSVDCKGCLIRGHRMGERARVRVIQRWEHLEVIDRHKERMGLGVEKMKERGKVVEYQFGTLKSRCGVHQFLMRGLEKCRGEFSLMTMAYNFIRALNILGARKLREHCAGRRVYGPQMA